MSLKPILGTPFSLLPPGDQWRCMFFAEHLVPYIKTPMFIVQSKYDYWQMDSNIYCKMYNIESSRYARQGKQKRGCEDNA